LDDRVTVLEKRLGLPLADRAAALAALTHKSYVNEHRAEALVDNERLEFLGDAVIDLAVSHRLMELFPEAQEGTLSKLRASIVNELGLSRVAQDIGLGELLLLGRGEEQTGGRSKPSVLADALEAVVAALYLGGGLPLVLRFVDRFFGNVLGNASSDMPDRDYKTQVQELAQGRLRATPRYRVIDEQGPDHAKTFVVEVTISGQAYGTGEGRSKKDAEQLAARKALERLAAELGPESGGA
jgi:ribonuclease III